MPHECLSIGLLGGFRLIGHCEPETAIAAGRISLRLQLLLAYLLLHRDAPQPREHLAFLFWPDTSEAQALTNLRNLLHKLRRLLPAPDLYLQIDSRTVQWRPNSPFVLDVADFEHAVKEATTVTALAQAVDYYRGDLLPGCYDEWLVRERERLRQLVLVALDQLIDQLESNREYRSAIRFGQRLLQLEPFNEAIYRRLISLHAADNDRAGALQLYTRCVAMLQEEFAATPTQETLELFARLHHNEQTLPSPVDAPTDQPPLVGRSAEWRQLLNSWYRASGGNSHCLLIAGEAGIGKTRLATELQSWVERQGFVTAGAHGYAAEGTLAYTPIVEWLHAPALYQQIAAVDEIWLTEVARLIPELLPLYPRLTAPGPLTSGWQQQRFFEALARTLLDQGMPRLLLLDNLQWVDRDTLAWLHYLLRFSRGQTGGHARHSAQPTSRLLLLATVRSEAVDEHHPLHEWLAALRHDDALAEVTLSGLTRDETRLLADSLAPKAFTDHQHHYIFRETEGNPLFIVEMVRAGLERNIVAEWDVAPAGPGEYEPLVVVGAPTKYGPLPPKVHGLIQARLAELSATAHEIAILAATIGRAFAYPVLARAFAHDEETLVQGLDELCQRRIIRERNAEVYDFTHDKLREVTYSSLSAARRRLAHKAVAQALELVHRGEGNNGVVQTQAIVSGQIANHYELAGITDKAVYYYQQAAIAAHQLSANQDAMRAYRRALSLLDNTSMPNVALRMALHEQLGDLLCMLGQYSEARPHFVQALTQAAPAAALPCARLHRKVGSTWRDEYQYPQAIQFYNAAIHALLHPDTLAHAVDLAQHPTAPAPVVPSNEQPAVGTQSAAWWEEWIQIQLEIDLVHYWLAESAASVQRHQQLAPLIEQHATAGQRATFFQRRTQLALRRHRSVATAEAVAYARRSLAIYKEAAMAEPLAAAHFMLGFTLLWYGDLPAAQAELQEALQMAQARGDRSLQARALTYLTIVARQQDAVAATATLATAALAMADEAHMPEYVALAHANQAWLAWRAHDDDGVRDHGRAALALWQQLPVTHASAPFQWTALWPLMAVALADEELPAAVDCARALLDPHQQQLPEPVTTTLIQLQKHWSAGDTSQAVSLLNQAVAQARQRHYL